LTKLEPVPNTEAVSEYEKVWRAFDNNEVTHSTAHYLLAVASLAERGDPPRAADVARQLGVSRAAVSMQLKTLREHDLVQIGKDNRLELSRHGADLVARIASKREVLKQFLHEILGVDDQVAERDACKIEHLVSEESGAALVRFIRFLHSDDTVSIDFVNRFKESTAACPPDTTCRLCREICLLRMAGEEQPLDNPQV
jgi:DtxR family Mn-dependent transcriptional regulator